MTTTKGTNNGDNLDISVLMGAIRVEVDERQNISGSLIRPVRIKILGFPIFERKGRPSQETTDQSSGSQESTAKPQNRMEEIPVLD